MCAYNFSFNLDVHPNSRLHSICQFLCPGMLPYVNIHTYPCIHMYDDDCFYYYKKQFSTLDLGSMRSNLGIKIWDYRWFASTSFVFLFRKKKCVKERKQLVQDLIPPLNIYIHMCTSYKYTNICMSRFRPSGFFGPSRCLIPTPGLTIEHMCSH